MRLPVSPEVWGLGFILVLLGLWLGLRASTWLVRRRGRARSRQGLRGERVAVRLLEKAGFEIVELQAPGETIVTTDGEEHCFTLRADALVRRGEEDFVAEFKTGAAATVGNRSTRRQLLEYAIAYPDHRMLLVDATQRTIHEVEFPGL